jgi:Bacterial Ig-like domain/IPT/TIG domain
MSGSGIRRVRSSSLIGLVALIAALLPATKAFASHSVTSVTPSALGRGAVGQNLVINGSNFLPTATVAFSPATGITQNGGVTYNSSSQLTVNVTIAVDAPTGTRTVTVTNIVGDVASCNSCLTINPAPVPTSVNPSTLGQGALNVPVTISGSGFVSGASVSVSGTGVSVGTVNVQNATTITTTMTVSTSAAPGTRNVRVTNPDHGSAACACLTIAQGPSVTAVSPTFGSNSGSTNLTVTGTGFDSGATVRLVKSGQSDIVGTNTQFVSSTSIKATVNLTLAAPGTWDVVVINPDNGRGVCSACFTVTGSAPTVTALNTGGTPSDTLGQGASQVNVTLTGTNFAHGATVTIEGTGVTAGATTVNSSTSLVVPITVASDAATGDRDVTVTNTDGQAATCANCLTIATGPTFATLNPVTPTSRGQGAQDQDFSISGTGFQDGATVTFSGTGVTAGTVTVDSPTSITTTIDVSSTAATGARDVFVTNPDFGRATCSGCFTVNPKPTITSLNPNALGQGVTNHDVVVTGTNFTSLNGGTVLSFSPSTGITINGAPTINVQGTQLTVNVTIASDAPIGARDVIVTNPDAGTSTCDDCFTVGKKPTLTSASPNQLGQGASAQPVTLTGTDFVSGATVSTPGGSGVSVGTVQFVDAQHLTVPLTVAADATVGTVALTVTNPDGGSATCSNCLTITAAPVVTSVGPPSSLGQGASNASLTLHGTGFQTGMTIAVSGSGVTVTNPVTVTNATTATAVMSVSSNAAVGGRTITATNPDHGTSGSTCDPCITITAKPTITSVTPHGGSNTGSTIITITGTGFAATPQVRLERAGQDPIVADTVTFIDSAHITASVDLTLAAPGAWDVTVENPDHGTGHCSEAADPTQCAFTVAGSAPTVTGVDPDTLGQGALNVPVDITGTNFANGSTVSVGSGVTVTNVHVVSSTEITAVFTVSSSASVGARTVTVTNTDGQSGGCAGCLTISAGPTISSISPTSRAQGTTDQPFSIVGSAFHGGATVAFSPNTGITVGTVDVPSANSISTTITVASDAPTTARDVIVTNPDDFGRGVCSLCFTVTSKPTLAKADPDTAGQGAVGRQITLTGTGFQNGAAVAFNPASGITVGTTTVNNATTITVSIDVASNAATTARDIIVTNPDGGTATCTGCITITAAPTVTSPTPDHLGQGATNQEVDVPGSGFVDGATVSFSGTGVSLVGSTTFNGATSLTVHVTVSSTAATGQRDVIVTNPDGGRGVCQGCFTVNPAPKVTSISPAQRGKGLSGQALSFTGTGFTPSTTVSFSPAGVTVDNTVFGSSTSGTVTVSIASDAATGSRIVTLTNPDHGTSVCIACFAVTGPTTVTFATPTTLAGNVVVGFSQPVSGVSPSNVYMRVTGATSDVSAALTCAGASGQAVDCATGAVRSATLNPAANLLAGQFYTVYVASGITDYGGLAVAPTSHPFRASTNEQENSVGAKYAWRTVSSSSAYGGSYTIDHLASARASFTFNGPSVAWYTNTGRNYGLAYVYIDGHLKGSFNQYASSTHYKVARSFGGLGSGAHTITMVVRGVKGSSSGTGTDIAVDAFTVGGTRYNTPTATYLWRRSGNSHASGGAYAQSDRGGSSVTFGFRGTKVVWYTILGPSMGKAAVYIDGVLKATYDNYSSTTRYGYGRSISGLSNAVHTIKIRVLGTRRSASAGTFIVVDRWVVY